MTRIEEMEKATMAITRESNTSSVIIEVYNGHTTLEYFECSPFEADAIKLMMRVRYN